MSIWEWYANHTNTTPHCSYLSVIPYQQPSPPGSSGMSYTGTIGAYYSAPQPNPAYHSAPPTPYINANNTMVYDAGSMQSTRLALAKIITRSILSEYQIRQYGKLVDSCSKNHILPPSSILKGIHHFETCDENHIHLIDRGSLMGFPVFVYDNGNDLEYTIVKISSKERLTSFRHGYINKDSPNSFVFIHDSFAAAAALVQQDISDFRVGRV